MQIEGRGMRGASSDAMQEFLESHRGRGHTLVAAATDSSALGVLDTVRKYHQEQNFAIVGQDCIPEAIEEMNSGSSALIGSISHRTETYGPRLIHLGISLLRGFAVPPYNYVQHCAITPEALAGEAPGSTVSSEEGVREVLLS